MTLQERIDLLCKARNLLSKPVLASIDVVLAYDYIDMVIDELVFDKFEKERNNKSKKKHANRNIT